MSDYKIDLDSLARNFKAKDNLFYQHFQKEIRELFINRGHFLTSDEYDDATPNNTAEILYIGNDLLKLCDEKSIKKLYHIVKDWKWYVTKRISSENGNEIKSTPEEDYLSFLLIHQKTKKPKEYFLFMERQDMVKLLF